MAAPNQCGCRIVVEGPCTALPTAALAQEAVDADSTCRSGLNIPAAPSGSHPSAPNVPVPSSYPKSKPMKPRYHRQPEPGLGRRIVIPIPLNRAFIGVLAPLSPAPQSPILLSPLKHHIHHLTPAPEAPTHHLQRYRLKHTCGHRESLQDPVLRKLKQRAEVGV